METDKIPANAPLPEQLPVTFFAFLDKDFKAEVTAAEIAALGIPVENIILLMMGAMKRSPRKDVLSVEEELSAFTHKEYYVVKTPREGIYDMLPEGLFHRLSAHRTANTVSEIAASIRKRKEEEQHARRFFIPFESAINHLRVEMAFYENRFDQRTNYDDLASVFSGYWEIFKYLDARQTDIILHLIPILHDVRDNHPVIETIMNEVFLLPVRLTLRQQAVMRQETPLFSMLGDSTLGADLTTGNEWFNNGEDEILISIGPVTNAVFEDFRQGGNRHRILELLTDYLLPVHLDIVTAFNLQQEDRFTQFAAGNQHLNSVLGVDTYL